MRNKIGKLNTRAWDVFWLCLIGAMCTGIVIVALLLMRAPQPPFTYSQAVYQPVDSTVCAGDTLTWTVQVTPTRFPYAEQVTRALYVVKNQRIRDVGKSFSVPVLYESPYEQTVGYALPLGLEPGEYEVHSVSNTEGSGYLAYKVPFVIEEECGADLTAPEG